MKKFWLILLTCAMTVCLALGISACGDKTPADQTGDGGTQTEQPGGEQKPDGGQGGSQTTPGDTPAPHVHSYSSLWSSDEENHWHAATCDHNVKQDEAPHTYVNGVCSTCNHVHVNHSFGGYTADDSEHAKTCTVCHKTESATHIYVNGVCSTCNHVHANHSFDSYTSNDENHTHVCSVCHKTETGSHTYANGVCSTCNHVHVNHSFGGYTSNDETHAHTCTVCHKTESATHIYQNGVCTTCNHAHQNHVYGEWVDDILASETQTGSRHKDCFCGNRVTEETPKISAFEFERSGNGYAVTAYTGSLTELVVPAEHEGKPVTAIASKAFYDGEFTSIKLPASIKEIGESAFGYCTKLQSIEIPNCARIENSAFVGCAALQEITLPADNIFLGVSLFSYCSALEKVTVKGGTVQSATFSGAETVKEMILEEGVKSIAQGAFASCKNLQKLTLPRVDTTSSFMRYYFNVTPKIYTMSRTEDGPEISDLYPDEVVSHQYRNHYFALPKDYTDWYYDGKTIEVDGTVYTYDGKPVNVLSWKLFYDITANAYWYGPKSWSATFYYCPETSLERLTITNQLVSVYDKIFEECACDIDIWEKFPITTLSVKGATECYIDEFSQGNYKLRVEYSDGFKEDFPLFDHISEEDQTTLRTVGEHEITAHYQDKSCTATINVRLHTFDEAVLESAEHIYDGSAFSLEVTGAPEGTDIAYTGNGQSEVGEHTVTATLTKQYYETKTLTATLNILKQRYEIIYDFGLENVVNDNPSDYETDGENIKLKDPVRPGWEFVGWYTEAELQNKITEIKGNTHRDVTIYAKWKTVFTLNGGEITGLNDYGKQQTELIIDETIDGTKITSIGAMAFYNNKKLQKITIGSGVTSIGSSAFYYCIVLKEVHITDLAAWCRIDFSNNTSNPLYCARHLYLDGAEIKNLTIPSEIREIKDYAFYCCDGLESVTIPDSVTSIGGYAFADCSGLPSISIPDSVSTIGDNAFYRCSGLKEVHITDLAAWCRIDFNGNQSNPLYYAPHLYLDGNEVKDLTIPSEITEIKAHAFRDCRGLESVTIGSGVTSIGVDAFYGCSGLKEVHITDLAAWCRIDFGSSGANPLSNAHHLYLSGNEVKDLTIPSEIKEIKDYAFYDCDGLTSITIGSGVTSIGREAVYGCSGLESVTIGSGVTLIGDNAFWNCSGLENVIWNAENCTKAGSYSNNSHTLDYTIFRNCTNLNNVTFGENVKTIPEYAFCNCSGLTSITIPDSVTSIGDSAFYGCSGLKSVTIESGSIGEYAFEYCSGLTSVTIGSGVTSIGWGAFDGCSGLTSITIPDSVTSIGYKAFYNCSGLTNVTIGSGVTSIGIMAFSGCSELTSVTIGSGVTSIGGYAFSGCSGLRVYYKGSAEEWGNISIDNTYSANSYLLNATRYYFTEDAPTAEEWAEWNYWWHYDPATSLPTPWVKDQ